MSEMYRSRNMNYIFYKEYFQDIADVSQVPGMMTKRTEAIVDFSYQEEFGHICILKEMYEKQGVPLVKILLKTEYPGLLAGIGIPHELKGQGGVNGGFAFDHVTGIPFISGSEVKGVLRSYFPMMRTENVEEYEAFIRELLAESTLDLSDFDSADFDLAELETILFEGKVRYIGGFPLIKEGDKILAQEFFTPHKSRLRNPNPVSIIKVKPGVTFEFLFDMSELDQEFKRAEDPLIRKLDFTIIRNLFQELLVLGGIGAKRNVGFSQFREV